jgi:pimeloyl-ACP methyl ester carboxylesterase
VDLPLHGRTPVQPGQDLSLTGLARVVEDFCAALDLSGVDLVANDTGGAVAEIVRPGHPLARALGRAPRQRPPGLGHPLAR